MNSQGETSPIYVKAVTHLEKDVASLERLTCTTNPPVQQLRSRPQAVAYLIGYTSGKDFRYALWRETVVG